MTNMEIKSKSVKVYVLIDCDWQFKKNTSILIKEILCHMKQKDLKFLTFK